MWNLRRNDYDFSGKLFYFDKRKCIQVTNFASKLTLILADVKMDDLPSVGNTIAYYLFLLYEGNISMHKALKKHFAEHPIMCFSRFISNGILHTVELNRKINRDWIFSEKKNGKVEYFISAERFELLMIERYKDKWI